LTRKEIVAVIVHCTPYAGYPKVNHALAAAFRAFKEVDEKGTSRADGQPVKKVSKSKKKKS
jgi:hypothetical protein